MSAWERIGLTALILTVLYLLALVGPLVVLALGQLWAYALYGHNSHLIEHFYTARYGAVTAVAFLTGFSLYVLGEWTAALVRWARRAYEPRSLPMGPRRHPSD